MAKPRLKRALKAITILFLLALTAYGSLYGYHYAQLQRELSTWRELGYPTNMEELRAWDTVEKPAENAAIPIEKALEIITTNKDRLDGLRLPLSGEEAIEIGDTEHYSSEVIGDIGKMLEINRDALDLIHDSNHLKKYRPKLSGTAWTGEHTDRGMPLRDLIRYLIEESVYYSETGDMDTAIDSIRSALWISDMYRQYSDLMSLLVGEAFQQIGVAAVVVIPSRYEPTDQQIQDLLAILNGLESHESYIRPTVGEPVYMREYNFIYPYESLVEHGMPELFDSVLEFVHQKKQDLYFLYPWHPKTIHATFKAARTQVSVLAHEKWFEVPDELLTNKNRDFLEQLLYTSHTHVASSIFERRARTKSIKIGLQVERFRLKYGRLPETLEDLVPEFIEAVPHGLFVDEPIGYEIDDAGYVVYAVAESRVEEIKKDHYDEECDCVVPYQFGFRRYLKESVLQNSLLHVVH